MSHHIFDTLFNVLLKKGFITTSGSQLWHMQILSDHKKSMNFNFEFIYVQMKNLYMRRVKDNTNIKYIFIQKISKRQSSIKICRNFELSQANHRNN